ncbi:MAG: MFS transporter [Aestuariivirga sp.]|uniref:MFS transporter n=1 Tax=Aestuariivirga sp. TaxID=2650926 RepID=UPI0025BAA269|nr:MFS transporter [Aestuariivirga sp.]MCA3562691.1 MFS transporter [Aestuariivirga sp.]
MANTATGHVKGDLDQGKAMVVFASSLGTVFEWYDFYLYGSLAAIIAKQFFSGVNETAGFIFALAAFAAGFIVRPFGALVFGRLGDLVGRKYTFLITILIMGLSTFGVGLLPTYATIGIAAPIILVLLRVLQGLALGGEYGGAATYVAEHAPDNKRGLYTSWIQTTATLGLFLSLLVILGCRTYFGPEFDVWAWRIPFLLSVVLLAISVWIRLMLNESPVFQKMKEEGKGSKAPLTEAFANWGNLKIVILALFGLVAGQAVVWYTGQFYALFFLTQTLKVDPVSANLWIAASLALGTPFFIFWGWLSDKIGRKPIIMLGCFLALASYFTIFEQITKNANPALYDAMAKSKVTVVADPADCSFQFNPVGTSKFTSACDIAKTALVKAGVPYSNEAGPAGSAQIKIGDVTIPSFSAAQIAEQAKPKNEELAASLKAAGVDGIAAVAAAADTAIGEFVTAAGLKDGRHNDDPAKDKTLAGLIAAGMASDAFKNAPDKTVALGTLVDAAVKAGGFGSAMTEGFNAALGGALKAAGYPAKADPAKWNAPMVIFLLWLLVLLVTMVYGPIAAMLVEMFPTRIRYSSMSLPYHIGNGWFGGLLPTFAFAIVAATGNIYSGLWYPIIIAGMTLVIGMLFVKDTRNVDIHR